MSELGELINGIYKKAAMDDLGRNALIGAGLGGLAGAGKYYMMDDKKKRRSSLLNHALGGAALGTAGGAAVSALPSFTGMMSTGNSDGNRRNWLTGALFEGANTAARIGGGYKMLQDKAQSSAVDKLMMQKLKGLGTTSRFDRSGDIPSWYKDVAGVAGVPGIKERSGTEMLNTYDGAGKVIKAQEKPYSFYENLSGDVMKKLESDPTARQAAGKLFGKSGDPSVKDIKGKVSGKQIAMLVLPQLARLMSDSNTAGGAAWRGAMDAATGAGLGHNLGAGRNPYQWGAGGLGVGAAMDKLFDVGRSRTDDWLARMGFGG